MWRIISSHVVPWNVRVGAVRLLGNRHIKDVVKLWQSVNTSIPVIAAHRRTPGEREP
jgi:hypothetical protein